MYKIELKQSGFLLTFGGFMDMDEMESWYKDSENVLESPPESFGLIVDMRDLRPLPVDAQSLMVKGQQMYKQKGMKRSAVILNSPITTMQFKRLAQESGIYDYERYIDASSTARFKEVATEWVRDGIDPDNNGITH
ncbi:hypothetical protein ACFLQK_02215 [bacterium]